MSETLSSCFFLKRSYFPCLSVKVHWIWWHEIFTLPELYNPILPRYPQGDTHTHTHTHTQTCVCQPAASLHWQAGCFLGVGVVGVCGVRWPWWPWRCAGVNSASACHGTFASVFCWREREREERERERERERSIIQSRWRSTGGSMHKW